MSTPATVEGYEYPCYSGRLCVPLLQWKDMSTPATVEGEPGTQNGGHHAAGDKPSSCHIGYVASYGYLHVIVRGLAAVGSS